MNYRPPLKKARTSITVDALADHLGFASSGELWDFARRMPHLFWPTIKRRVKGGKRRELDRPRPGKAKLLKPIARRLCVVLPPHACAHGGVKRRSNITAMRSLAPVGSGHLLSYDLADAYPSVRSGMFYDELVACGFSRDVARVLTLMCCIHGRIPQGSPLSAFALNLHLFRLDVELNALARRFDGLYIRFADDLVVRVPVSVKARAVDEQVAAAINATGLTINTKKRADRIPDEALGLRFSASRKVLVARDYQEKAILAAKRYSTSASAAAPPSLDDLWRLRMKAQGHLTYVRQTSSRCGRYISRLIREGDERVRQRIGEAVLASNPRWAKLANRSS